MNLLTTIRSAEITFTEQPFLKPLQLSSGLITEITEVRATVQVEVAGRTGTGHGSIYLSDLWAWPDPALTHEQRDAILRGICTRIANNLAELCGDEPAHPLELGLRLHHAVCEEEIAALDSRVTPLALAMCASPFDAAIHDAVGQALQRSAFEFYDEPYVIPSADRYFANEAGSESADGNTIRAIRRALNAPRPRLDAWLIVGAADKLPDAIKPWVQERGYRGFKIKLLAKDNAVDVARTVEVYRSARECGVEDVRLSIDSNEGNADAFSVLDYLKRLRDADTEAFEALEYIEQPTARDISEHPFDWYAVSLHKPVLLDEGLTSLDLLETARQQHWSGFALKTCKGHSFALTTAAWALENGLVLAMQDLTNPGLAAIHSALVAAHLPVINGVELNSPQYTPAANTRWLPRLAGLLEPRDGYHTISALDTVGLGSAS